VSKRAPAVDFGALFGVPSPTAEGEAETFADAWSAWAAAHPTPAPTPKRKPSPAPPPCASHPRREAYAASLKAATADAKLARLKAEYAKLRGKMKLAPAYSRIYLNLDGAIGKAFGKWSACDVDRLVEKLRSNPKAREIVVQINSPGGSVADADRLCLHIAAHGGHVRCVVGKVAASAAVRVLLQSDERIATPASRIAVHTAEIDASGSAIRQTRWTSSEHLFAAAALQKNDREMKRIYSERTGQTADVIAKLLVTDSILSACEALRLGFITRITSR
jgi:ATP-dependent protease ClpP protease subunit